MLAYKFRGADQVAFAVDIILNKRLYCSSPSKLNDPLEGFFSAMVFESIERAKQAYRDVIQERSHLSVCSLSTTYDFIPLWAYYASNFTGLAIEVEIPADVAEVKHVRYTNYPTLGSLPEDNPGEAARESLCMKREEWRHESEVRIILDDRQTRAAPYYPLTLDSPVRRLIVGQRMEPALLTTFKIVCKDQGIEICQAQLGPGGVSLVGVPF